MSMPFACGPIYCGAKAPLRALPNGRRGAAARTGPKVIDLPATVGGQSVETEEKIMFMSKSARTAGVAGLTLLGMIVGASAAQAAMPHLPIKSGQTAQVTDTGSTATAPSPAMDPDNESHDTGPQPSRHSDSTAAHGAGGHGGGHSRR